MLTLLNVLNIYSRTHVIHPVLKLACTMSLIHPVSACTVQPRLCRASLVPGAEEESWYTLMRFRLIKNGVAHVYDVYTVYGRVL